MTCTYTVPVRTIDALEYATVLTRKRQAQYDKWKAEYDAKRHKFESSILCKMWKKLTGKCPEYDMGIAQAFQHIRVHDSLLEAQDLLMAIRYRAERVTADAIEDDIYLMPVDESIRFHEWFYKQREKK